LFTTKFFARLLTSGLAVSFVLVASTAALGQTKLLRFPDIHGDRVAFTYGGDIWTAAAEWWQRNPSDCPSRDGSIREVLA
jgi:tricorn protease-like protein